MDQESKLDELLAGVLETPETGAAPQGGDCPPVESVAAYLEDRLSDKERESFEEHLTDCAQCRRVLAAAAGDLADASLPPHAWLKEAKGLMPPPQEAGRSPVSGPISTTSGWAKALRGLFSLPRLAPLGATAMAAVLLFVVLASLPQTQQQTVQFALEQAPAPAMAPLKESKESAETIVKTEAPRPAPAPLPSPMAAASRMKAKKTYRASKPRLAMAPARHAGPENTLAYKKKAGPARAPSAPPAGMALRGRSAGLALLSLKVLEGDYDRQKLAGRVRSLLPKISACYLPADPKGRTGPKAFEVRLMISPKGELLSMTKSPGGRLEECVLSCLQGQNLPRPSGEKPAVLAMRFVLK